MGRFAELSAVLDQVKGTTSKNEKVRILSDFLRPLSAEEATFVARFATGRPTTKGSVDETQMGYSSILEVLEEITGVRPRDMSDVYLRHGDLGDVASEILQKKLETTLSTGDLSVMEVAASFARIAECKGKGSAGKKKLILKSMLLSASPVEAKYIIKILTREMRIGLVDGLMEEAIAKAASEDHERVREVHLLLGDIGLLARWVKTGEFREARLEKLRPTNFMLAEPMISAEEIWKYFQRELYGEYKYDGVRAQVHKSGDQVRVFSRRLEDISASFPEVVESVQTIRHDVIIDGEIVAFSAGRPLPFQLLQRRLRSKRAPAGIPVQYFCFDILLLDDDQLYKQPLRVRKERLGAALAGSPLPLAVSEIVSSEEQIEGLFRLSRSLGYEGLVLKEPESPYTPGRRGRYWVKLKEELDSIDAVIVAAEYGHGKRAGVISDYTFAVRDGDSLKVIGKAYSGLTDEEIDTMTSRIKAITVVDHGFRREVRPEIVLEIAFDSIQRSDRHDSGFALRFPRIKRIREDKRIDETDTIEKVRNIFDSQKVRLDET